MTRGSHLGIKIRRQCFSSSETLHEKSFPVRVLMLYACGGASTGTVTANHSAMQGISSATLHEQVMAFGSLFGGTRGLLLEAHHPTGCISGMQRLHQKSLLLSLSKPSYLRRALNPARNKTQLITDRGSSVKHSSKSTFKACFVFELHHVFIRRGGLLISLLILWRKPVQCGLKVQKKEVDIKLKRRASSNTIKGKHIDRHLLRWYFSSSFGQMLTTIYVEIFFFPPNWREQNENS